MDKKNITFSNPEQIINMGGPYVGRLEINDYFTFNNVIMENYIVKDNLIYFIAYKGNSKWAKDNYFSIFYYDYTQRSLFEIKQKFQEIFLKEFTSENHIKIYEAFHDKNPNYESIIDISKIPHVKVDFPRSR